MTSCFSFTSRVVLSAILWDEYLTSAVRTKMLGKYDLFTVLILTLIQRMDPGACEMPDSRGRLPYKSDRDAHWKIQIKPLRKTNVGVA